MLYVACSSNCRYKGGLLPKALLLRTAVYSVKVSNGRDECM